MFHTWRSAKLTAQGIAFRSEEYGGGVQASLYFCDPLGNNIEITAWPTHASTHASLGQVASSSLPPTPLKHQQQHKAPLFHHASFVAGLAGGIAIAMLVQRVMVARQ